MDLFHKIYQIMTKDSYIPFLIASLTGLRICHFPLYGDFQMPENTKRSDYQCEIPKNWITGRPFFKLVGGNVRLNRPKFSKIFKETVYKHCFFKSGHDQRKNQK